MLTFLLYLFLKRFFSQHWATIEAFIAKCRKYRITFFSSFLQTIFISAISISATAQNNPLHYKVLFNGHDIGWMRLEKNVTDGKVNLQLTSEIKTKIIFSITVFTKESSVFENGRLVFSSLLRKTNGSVKTNKQTKLVGDQYEVSEEGEKSRFKSPLIDLNLLSLYFNEPTTLKSVYWDKKNCFIKIIKMEDGGYMTKFSNGNSNRFYYKNGICTKVKIEHMFYSAEIVFDQ